MLSSDLANRCVSFHQQPPEDPKRRCILAKTSLVEACASLPNSQLVNGSCFFVLEEEVSW